ncbi:MAG: flagellar filament capping protein FliD [Rubricoccaceae bacterium]
MTNITTLATAGSAYEQLISQVIGLESRQQRQLESEKSDQTVYKAILSDFSSAASTLDSLMDRFTDPLRSPFEARAASVPEGAGFSALTSDAASAGQHEIRVERLARADARLSRRIDNAGTTLSGLSGSFTLNIAQPEGDPVALEVNYTPSAGATDAEVLAGIASAVNDATATARADGLLAEGTGPTASVVGETGSASRLSIRSLSTGYANRLSFDDPNGILSNLEVTNTDVREGTGGGAVYAIGTGQEDSDLSAKLTLDGLDLYRDTNSFDDALSGVTLTLTGTTEEASTLSIGPDVEGMKADVESFIEAYNGLVSFINNKSTIDEEGSTRGVLAGDPSVRGLRSGLRADLLSGALDGGISLADLGIETARDGTLTLKDAEALTDQLEASPETVGALFSGDGSVGDRFVNRLEGFLGPTGSIAQRRDSADARIKRLDSQIERWDVRLERRADSLRAQFAQLDAISAQAQGQQATIAGLFYF